MENQAMHTACGRRQLWMYSAGAELLRLTCAKMSQPLSCWLVLNKEKKGANAALT